MQDLSGKTAVVTGAASGIGLATARALAEAGMRVVLADVEETALAEAQAALAGEGHDVLAVPTDVSKWDQVERLAERTVEHYGAVHVLHNNAGVVTAGPVETLSLEDWEWVLGVDLWSVIYGIKAFLPHIKRAGEGHVINTASVAGLYATSWIAPYNVAKFGVVALTETLARELESDGLPIRASVLCPGPVDTGIVTSERNRPDAVTRAHADSPQERQFLEGSKALLSGRGRKPAEVAALVLEAIGDGRFWILPHPYIVDVLRTRAEGMGAGGKLDKP